MERLPHSFRRARFGQLRSKHTAIAVACLAAMSLPAVVPGAAADDLRDKQSEVKKGIKQATEHLEESSAAAANAVTRLKTARTQLASAQQRLAVAEGKLTAAKVLDAQMQAKLAEAEAALAQAEQELKDGIADVVEQRADVGRLAAENFQYGDPKLMGLAVVLNSQDPTELTTQLNTVDNLMSRETAALERFKAAQAMLETRRDRVDAARAAVAEKRQEAAVNLARTAKLEASAQSARDKVATLVGERASAAAAARRAKAADRKKLRQLKREEQRIKRLIMERAKKQKGGYSGDAGGFLLRPVPGYVTSPFGWRKHPIYGYWGLHDGADFHAPCGSALRAGSGGTVIAEYSSSVWGNRLLLDVGRVNGKTMTLIYNHISSYKVREGAKVSRGDTVALAGSTGWSTGCHLHFTVMLNGSAVDPVQFF